MQRESEQLPDGTSFMDVVAAAQAAWLANDYVLARDLIKRYIDPNGEFCCMRCSTMEHEPWRVNTAIGTFFVCPPCTTALSSDLQFVKTLNSSGEVFMQGPVERVVQRTRRENCVVVEVKTSQQHVTVVKR